MTSGDTPSFTLEELAELTQSKLMGDGQLRICGVADLISADETQASFLANRKYLPHLKDSRAGAIFISKEFSLVEGKNYFLCDDPSLSFQKVATLFLQGMRSFTGFEGVHPTAVIHPTASIGKNVAIGPLTVIDEGVQIGDNTIIGSLCYVGKESSIGCDCLLYPNVVVRESCIIKNRVILQPGAVIGSCGFGYHTDKLGKHTKLEQLGNVIIEDDVEVGAGTMIDRARIDSTIIRKGSKIDNLVQIAHNVEIGEDNLIVAQTGIAGSSKTGKRVVMAGQSALVGHISIADNTIIAARGGLSKTITTPGQIFSGSPALPIKEYNRQCVYLRNIEKYVKRIEELETAVKQLRDSNS